MCTSVLLIHYKPENLVYCCIEMWPSRLRLHTCYSFKAYSPLPPPTSQIILGALVSPPSTMSRIYMLELHVNSFLGEVKSWCNPLSLLIVMFLFCWGTRWRQSTSQWRNVHQTEWSWVFIQFPNIAVFCKIPFPQGQLVMQQVEAHEGDR